MVHYKIIQHERYEDAPFVGALISSIDCKFNCKNCFNQNIKNMPTLEKTEKEIINEIKSNPFNQGIILAGLEWSLQKEELILLVKEAIVNNLQVIIYTGHKKQDFLELFSELIGLPIYIKCGRYDESLLDEQYYSFDVKLQSTNQFIFRMDDDINDK